MQSPMLKKIIPFGILAIVATIGISLYVAQREREGSGENISDGIKSAIEVEHIFEDGVHTYRGLITVPTPCHDIVSTVTVMESYPEQVMIDLKKEGASNFCAQVISQAPFEATFQASKDARVSARLDGEPVRLVITEKKTTRENTSSIPVPGIETPDTEVFDDSFLYEGSTVE